MNSPLSSGSAARPDRVGAWSRYWATGARHACASSFAGHYGDNTADFWRQRFTGMQQAETLLELGCGNGSLIRFLAEQDGAQLPESIAAVDAAQIDQAWVATLPVAIQQRLSVYPSTSAESLPFPDKSISHVCSQYAIEYFATESLWQELQRVLRPQARLSVICHHAGSLLCEVARNESSHCEWLLATGCVLDRAEALLPIFFELATHGAAHLNQNPQAKERREQFNHVLMALEERARSHPHSDVLHDVAQQVMRVLNMASVAGNRDRASDALSLLRAVVQDSLLRANELIACALSGDDVQAWTERLQMIGMQKVAFAELHEHSQLFGWKLVAS